MAEEAEVGRLAFGFVAGKPLGLTLEGFLLGLFVWDEAEARNYP
jgi:hypothetical protein